MIKVQTFELEALLYQHPSTSSGHTPGRVPEYELSSSSGSIVVNMTTGKLKQFSGIDCSEFITKEQVLSALDGYESANDVDAFTMINLVRGITGKDEWLIDGEAAEYYRRFYGERAYEKALV